MTTTPPIIGNRHMFIRKAHWSLRLIGELKIYHCQTINEAEALLEKKGDILRKTFLQKIDPFIAEMNYGHYPPFTPLV